jgi:selenide,water dikinase
VLSASKCSAHIYTNRVPFFKDAIRLAEMNKVPGGTRANLKSFEPYIKWPVEITNTEKFLLNDAQTSGSLLIFVPGDKKDKLVTALQKENILAAHIGDVISEGIENSKRIFIE